MGQFSGIHRSDVLYPGTALQAAKKLMFYIRARLLSGRKSHSDEGFSPCAFSLFAR
jgi:hypothetical protein